MKMLTAEAFAIAFKSRDYATFIECFQPLVIKIASRIIRCVNICHVIEMSDFISCGSEAIIKCINAFKYRDDLSPCDNYKMFQHVVQLRIRSAILHEKDINHLPVHISRRVNEQLAKARVFIENADTAHRGAIIGLFMFHFGMTQTEARSTYELATSEFVFIDRIMETEYGDAEPIAIPVLDKGFRDMEFDDAMNNLSDSHRELLEQILNNGMTPTTIAHANKLPLPYIMKHCIKAMEELENG